MSEPNKGQRAVMVIAKNEFRDEEYADPKRIMESAGIEVTTASETAGPCKGKLGLNASADMDLTDALEEDWDATVFVGGGGAAGYFEDTNAHALARKAVSGGNVLGAICIAPTILGKAGLLKGVDVTSFPSEEGTLVSMGAHWTGEPVVTSEAVDQDAKIVTANGPQSASAFGVALVDAMDLADGRF